MTKTRIMALMMGFGTLVGVQASAQDIAAGEALYKSACRACHGPTAQGMASFPKLADKSVAHLTSRLEQYRAGEKVGPNTALMAPNAVDLSDADIADLAQFIVANAK